MRVDALVKLIVGKLGSGKTAYAVTKMLEALMAGQVVVSNIRLNREACEKYFGRVEVPWENYRFVPTDEIADNVDILLTHLCDGACLAIDEIHLFMNARKWKENMSKAEQFLLFLTQARKFSIDTYILTQDERNADAQLVRQATHIVRLLNWRHLPVLGTLIPLPVTVARICKPDGVTAVGKEYLWRRMPLLSCYDTHQKFSGLEVTGAAAAPVLGKRAKHMSYGAVLMGCGSVLVCIGYAFEWKANKERVEREADEALKAAAREERKAAQPVRVAPPTPAASGTLVAGAFVPDRVEPITKAERARIEYDLPRVYRWTPGIIVLVGGHKIGHGSFFLAGTVRGWKRDGGTLLLTLNSTEVPTIRLFHGNQPRPFLYDYKGSVIRGSSGPDGSAAAALVPGSHGMAQPGVGRPVGGVPATESLYIPGSGTAAQLVIPDAPPRSMLQEVNSPRIGAPNSAGGYSDAPSDFPSS